jgi:hypothetical protein
VPCADTHPRQHIGCKPPFIYTWSKFDQKMRSRSSSPGTSAFRYPFWRRTRLPTSEHGRYRHCPPPIPILLHAHQPSRSGRPQTDLNLDLHSPATHVFHTSASGTSILLSRFSSISLLTQDDYHGREETAKMCSRYINTLFHRPNQPQPSSTSPPTPNLPHFIAYAFRINGERVDDGVVAVELEYGSSFYPQRSVLPTHSPTSRKLNARSLPLTHSPQNFQRPKLNTKVSSGHCLLPLAEAEANEYSVGCMASAQIDSLWCVNVTMVLSAARSQSRTVKPMLPVITCESESYVCDGGGMS